MPFYVDYQESGYVRFLGIGEGTIHELQDGLPQVVDMAVETHCFRVMSDLRAMQLQLSPAGVFMILKLQEDMFQKLAVPAYKVRRAVVVSEMTLSGFQFFETAAVNRMHTVRVFTESEPAVTWLLG